MVQHCSITVAWNPTTLWRTREPPCPGGPSAKWTGTETQFLPKWVVLTVLRVIQQYHHQNPSAFKLDLSVLSSICNLYDADGLYVIDSTQHSPILGFAYDGYPIYGAYGYKNSDGTGGITRIKSSYQLKT